MVVRGLLLLSILMLALSVKAEDKVYVVGVGDYEYMPHHGMFKGQYTGFARDIIDLWAEKQGIQIKYRSLPWLRLVAEVSSGKIDFVYPDNPVWDGDLKAIKKVFYSDPVVTYAEGTLVKVENADIEKNQVKKIGIIRGFTPFTYNEEIASKKITLAEFNDISPLIKQVMIGRVDGAILEESVAHYYAREIGVEDALVFNRKLGYYSDKYYFSSIKHPEMIESFNTFLLSNQSFIKRLERAHGIVEIKPSKSEP